MMSFTTGGKDKLKQPLRPDDRVDLPAHWPGLDSSFGGSGDAHGVSFSRGSNLTSSLSTRHTCSPRTSSCSYGQSSSHGRQSEDLEADSEVEDGGTYTARMQSLVPFGLFQDDVRDYQEFQDSFPVQFPSEVEFRSGTNYSNGETESGHQEFLRRVSDQRCGKDGFVGARSGRGFDKFDCLSNDNGFAGGHVPTTAGEYVDPNLTGGYVTKPAGRYCPNPAGGYVPNPAEGFVPIPVGGYFPTPETESQYDEAIRREFYEPALRLHVASQYDEAIRREFYDPALRLHVARPDNANLSYFSGSQPCSQFGTVMPQMIIESPEQLRKMAREMTIRDSYLFAVCQKQLNEIEAFYAERLMQLMRARNVHGADPAADLRSYAERDNLYQQEGLHHDLRGLTSNNMIEQLSLLFDRSSAVQTNEVLAGGPRNRTDQQGHPTSDDHAFEKARFNEILLDSERLRNGLRFLDHAQNQAMINAELSQGNGFSSPEPTAMANIAICSATATSSYDSTPASIHPARLRPRSRDLREETSCVRSRLRNTPERKVPCNSYSPPRRKSTSSPSPVATKALIAQGAKSISVILKPEHLGSRGRSSHSASPLSPGSNPVSPGSGSLSPIRPRRLNMSNTDALQLIPTENPSLELDVCNQGQFKTELCNNWQDAGSCRYGEHCRFAHGVKELRCVLRHRRYKSVPCRMIVSGKECIYGHRCHYRHSFTEKELSLISEAKLVPRTSS